MAIKHPMEKSGSAQKSAHIALLMAVLGVIVFVSALVFELNSDWLGAFLIVTCLFSLIGLVVGIYSLLFKRSNSGLAAVGVSALMIVLFIILILLFRDMCVIC